MIRESKREWDYKSMRVKKLRSKLSLDRII